MRSSIGSHDKRLRMRILCAGVVVALCTACGPGGPRRDTGDGGGTSGGTSGTGITVLAGDATTAGSVNATGTAARFNTPRGIAIDSKGNLYVADELNFVIRRITSAGVVTIFAGTSGASDYIDGVGTDARFVDPTAIAIDASDNMFVTDRIMVRRITPDGVVTTVTTFDAGNNTSATSLNTIVPAGIAADGAGNLFVTTGIGTRRIPVANPNNAVQLEGVAARNNAAATATLTPRGIAVDGSGNAYVANLNLAISKIGAGGTSLAAYAGTDNQTGSTNDAGVSARFEQVVALTVDADGNLYAADAGSNNTVRKITPNLNVTTEAGKVGSSTLSTGSLPGSLAPLRGIVAGSNHTLYATSGNAVVKIVLP
jgi:sugar lactone lactonase YvrE